MNLNKAKRNAGDLKPGESGTVSELDMDRIPVRLLDMGCLPGAEIELCFRAPFGDPLYFQIGGHRLALRLELARHIHLHEQE